MTQDDGRALRGAIEALRGALAAGADLTAVPRMSFPVTAGELLLMPAADTRHVGTKLVSVAPANGALGLPRVQGVYVLMDAATLTPVWQGDAARLTVTRTTAMSMTGLLTVMQARGHPRVSRAVVFGSGPQAAEHVLALDVLGLADECVVVGRTPAKSAAAATASAVGCASLAVRAGSAADVGGAGLILCCTSAAEPLFAAGDVSDDAVVVAIGAHTPDHREVPTGLVGRAWVMGDGASAALTAGDVLLAARDLGRDVAVTTLGDVVRGTAQVRATGPWLFKSVGEAWQDLAVATALSGRTV
jgi:ornithine cyclodeaminase